MTIRTTGFGGSGGIGRSGRESRSGSVRRAAALVLLAAAVGCSNGDLAEPPEEVPADQWSGEPGDASLRVLAASPHAGLTDPARRVVRSQPEWNGVWTEWESFQSPKTDPPAVDFGREMVVLAALGTRPSGGYAIVIDSVTVTDAEAVVHVRTLAPGDGCVVTAALTHPAMAVAVPATSRTVRFAERAFVAHCD